MIYLQTTDKILTDDGQATFNFSLETAVLRKPLLVIYYNYKEKKRVGM